MSIPFNPITISVGKKSLSSFISLQIEQNIGKHHRFQMAVELETGSNRYVHNINSSKDWLGESIVVKAASTPIFVGVVTNVQLHREGSDFGCIIVSGYSATYRLETAHSCFSWNDRTIGDVVKKLCEQAKVQLELNPAFKETKDFICQYEESDFDFIRRLAHQYQEWMYFDGTKLIFGKPRKLADPIRLEYGTTLSSLDIGLQTLARSEQVFSYHSGADREMQRMTPDLAYGHDKLAGEAFRASLGMFSKPARQHALPRISNETELVNYMGRKQAAETAETHYITAESQVPTLRVGSVISLYSSFLERVGNLSEESLGNFIIIEITHEVSQGSYYKNRFKAIPATIKAMPSPKVRMPLAETQMATVLSNADPQGKGRVRVRMNWQTDGMQTGWVRVMTPDGGSSSDVKSNRGFVFIPEVGDQVLLGFRHGDPARPYVMGSLFNGTTGNGGGSNNSIKSLKTRSGISVILNDDNKSLTIKDAGGSSIWLDGNGNIQITAPHSINFTSTNITINAHNNTHISSGNNLTTNIGNNWLISVGNTINNVASHMRNIIAGSLNIFTGISLWSSHEKMQIQTESFTAIGSKKIFLHSDEKLLANSKGTLDIKSDGYVNTSSKADEAKKEKTGEISIAMVEFRPTSTYDGSFGFDWLRVDDNKLEEQSHYSEEQPYDSIIEGGYGDGKTDLTGGKDGSAYKKLKGEYEMIVVNMQDKSDGSKRTKEYFVPYLSIYPKSYIDTLTNTDQKNKPLFEAELALLVDIGVDEIDSLEFKYDKSIFDLDKVKLQDTKRTAAGKQFSMDKTIKITCKKEIPDLSSGEISVYAYPKDSKGKSAAEREAMRSLAGKIQVLPNGEERRKKQKFVLIRVKTNILPNNSTPQSGDFTEDELKIIRNVLFQSLIETEIIEERIDENSEKIPIELDLTNDDDFKIQSNGQIGKYVTEDGKIKNGDTETDKTGTSMVHSLRDKFLSEPKNSKFKDCFTVFAFGNVPFASSMAGRVENIGEKNVMLSPVESRWNSTLPHEALHGLGLHHTHADERPIKESSRIYIYRNRTTDNIMKYNNRIDNRRTTWHWQWGIVNKMLLIR